MRKVIAMTEGATKAIAKLRTAYFGENASCQSYRDSYIVNCAINNFDTDNKCELLSDKMSELDSQPKSPKTITLQASAVDVLTTLQKTLEISDSEAVRRILYYSEVHVEELNSPVEKAYDDDDALKLKISVLEKQLLDAIQTLDQIKDYIRGGSK